jgi:hypothetical protein
VLELAFGEALRNRRVEPVEPEEAQASPSTGGQAITVVVGPEPEEGGTESPTTI